MAKLPPSSQDRKGAKTRAAQGGRRGLRRLGVGVLAVVLAAVGFGGALAWQANRAAVNLDFLRSRLEAALQARLPAGSDLTIGSAAISYRPMEGLILIAREVSLAIPNMASGTIAELATVATPSALLSGRVDLDAVAVSGLDIAVGPLPRLVPEGSIADIVRRASELVLAQVGRADALIRGTGLEEVMVEEAVFRLRDRTGAPGPALKISEAGWRPSGAEGSRAWLQVQEAGGAGWGVTLERTGAEAAGAGVKLAIQGLPVAALAPDLADGPGEDAFYDAAVNLEARLVAEADGRFRELGGALSSAAGPLSVSGVDRIDVEEAAVTFALGATGDRMAFPSGGIRSGEGRLQFEGALDLSTPDAAMFIGRVSAGSLPTVGSGPVTLSGGVLLANLDLARRALDIERFHLSAEAGSLSAVGKAIFAGPAAGLSFTLSLTEMPAAVARAFWPPWVAEKTRRWFDANVQSGTLGPGTLHVNLPRDHIGWRARGRPLPADGLVGSLPFENAVFSPLAGFPPVRNAAGYVEFGNASATALLQSGVIGVPGKGELRADGTILVVPELGRAQPDGDLHLQLAGPAAALAALSNAPPFSIAARRGIEPDALTGDAQLLLDGRIPLYPGGFGTMTPTFRLALTEFSSAAPIDKRLIAEANLVLEGTAQSYTVEGEGTLDGLQASVDLIMGNGAPGQTDVTVTLDDAARERLGLSLGGLVTGPMQASIQQVEGGASQKVALDLKDARIAVPALGWEKGPGVPATASFLMEKTPEGTRILDLVIGGKGFGVEGEVSLGPDGRIRSADLPKFALRPGDDLSLSATGDESGFDVKVRGSALDARGIITAAGSGRAAGDGEMDPIRISLDVGSVTGQNGVVLSGVAGTLRVSGNGLDAAALKGSAGGGRSFEWTLGRENRQRVVKVRASDGGALIRFAGIYAKVVGGNLLLDYRGPIGGPGAGLAVMQDFRLLDERALAPAVETARQAASRAGPAHSGAVRAADLQQGGDLYFSQLRIPFRQDDWVVVIDDAALRGPLLGATASGTVNLPGKKMAISGTFIPAFGLNNIAGAIPIIGTILGGGRDEGLVGITFKFFGSVDNPTLAMNPISAIAPGIFRKIFEYR